MNGWERIKYEFSKGDSVIRKLLFINIGAFLFSILLAAINRAVGLEQGALMDLLLLPADIGKMIIRPWSIVTNIFLHGGLRHLLGNMLILFFIGRILEQFLTTRNLWTLFIGGGILGGIFFMVGYNLIPSLEGKLGSSLLGASGGVTAIVVAAGFHIPSYTIRPFGLFNAEMRWIALLLVVVLNLNTFAEGSNDGGLLAHLGGAVFGWLFIMHKQGRLTLPEIKLKKSKMKTVHFDESKRRKPGRSKPEQQEIDEILDKISKSGYHSLSEEEKQTLFNASE